ncbi:uncharacterized protein TRIADDRAFT_57058 [Trichoplax adhaerens]|uniref:ATP-binding cassette sub-family B member 10, mitochondrial n=1 Tax=Trichoplax adhaerens TaxID=10228 RepID=B3S0I3_TRIAD|nr:hypothetical protein TRIADDRAFT_57058 [Trichoplax adhaerens]EDV24013.1 hypothetical protein TRIADDRAFT_57058 [Trichoplax adhaerens]|eukprot:XP_002113539.1 hypothetical protein TRIADDRAFT_57058 [Trichoplax adhaerens]
MSVPYFMGDIIDVISSESARSGPMMDKLTQTCYILSGIFLIGSLANFGRVYLIQSAGQRIVRNIRQSLFGSVVKQEIAFFDKTRTGELINRMSTDTSVVGLSITNNLSDGLRALMQVSIGASMMIYVSPYLATVGIGMVAPLSIVLILYGRYLKTLSEKTQNALAASTEIAEEKISNFTTVRAFANEMKELTRYGEKIDKVLHLGNKQAFVNGTFFGFTGFSGNLLLLAVLWNGGMMMSQAQLTVGQLTSFLLYSGYVGIAIAGMSSFYSELMRGVGASTRLWQIIDRKPKIPIDAGIIPDISILNGDIDFKNIGFSYPSRSNDVIFKNLTLNVPAGSITAVVGASGSGKSTLSSLLLRFYDPDIGQVLINGEDIRSINPGWIRSNVGLVSQNPILFSTTIYENIAYGTQDAKSITAEEIIYAAKQANAMQFIDRFPDGLQTVVGERGQSLSGGQRQRIAIARALIKNPQILILDEATSALDAESEYLVQDALQRLMVNRTVITIAHRLSTIKHADQIVVLNEGKIVERGNYNDLMQLENGVFKKLIEKQSILIEN